MFNQESSGCFCLNICSQWLDFKNRSIEKIKAIFIFKKTNKTFFALLIISKKNEDIAISNTGLAVILLSVWRCIVFLLAFLGIFWSKKWGYSTQKFFFNILFWTTYKTFHALFKKEKLLLICIFYRQTKYQFSMNELLDTCLRIFSEPPSWIYTIIYNT